MTSGARAGWALAVGLVIGLIVAAAGAGRWLGRGQAGALVFDVSAPFSLDDDARVLKAWDARLRGREVTITRTERADVVQVTVSGEPGEAEAIAATLTRTGTLQMTEVVHDTEVARRWYARVRAGDGPADVSGETDAWTSERTGERHEDHYLRAPTSEALERGLAVLTADDPPPAALVVRLERVEPMGPVEPGESREPYYRTYLVAAAPILDGSHVARAQVSYNQDTLRPEVLVTFTEDGKRRFAEATDAMVGRKLAIVVDGAVVSAPLVMSRIAGGVSTITMGGADAERQERDAAALAAALRARLELPAGLVAELRATRPGVAGNPWLTPLLFGLLGAVLAFVATGRLARVATVAGPPPFARGLAGLPRVALGLVVTLGVPLLVLWLPTREEVEFLALPGVNVSEVANLARRGSVDTFANTPHPTSVFALGVMPVLAGFWIVELFAFATGRRHRLGAAGARWRLDRAALGLGLAIALLQGYFIAQYLESAGYATVLRGGPATTALITLTAAAGVAVHVVLAGVITRHGLCNGYLAFVGVGAARGLYHQLADDPAPFPDHRLALAACLAVLALVTVAVTALRDRTEARTRQPWPCLPALVVLGELISFAFLLVLGFEGASRLDLSSSWLWRLSVRPLWFDTLFACGALAFVVWRLRLPVTRLAIGSAAAIVATVVGLRWLAPSALVPATLILPASYAVFLAVEVVLALRARLGLARPVALVAVHDVERADRAADALAAAGIPASVEGLRLRALLRGLGGFAPIVIRVDTADAERAARVVADAEAAADPALATFAA